MLERHLSIQKNEKKKLSKKKSTVTQTHPSDRIPFFPLSFKTLLRKILFYFVKQTILFIDTRVIKAYFFEIRSNLDFFLYIKLGNMATNNQKDV